MTKTIQGIILTGVCWALSGLQGASAQWVVNDPNNLVQNIVSAVHSIQTVNNQITQLTHEVQSLAYQAQNLQSMPPGVANGILLQYTSQFGALVAAMQNIDGIARNVASLTATYNATFPNTALAQGPLSNANVMSQLSGWLSQSRSVYQGAYTTQAQVMASLPNDTATIQRLLQTSGSSQGALSVTQTGNQINGQIAAQLMKMNTQMATNDQAQLNWIAEQTQMIAQAQQMAQNLAVGYTNRGNPTVYLTYDRLH